MSRPVERRIEVPVRPLYDIITPILIGTPHHPLGPWGVANAIERRAASDGAWLDALLLRMLKPPEAAQ